MKEGKWKNANTKEKRICCRHMNNELLRAVDEARENGLDFSVMKWRNWKGGEDIYRWKKWHEIT